MKKIPQIIHYCWFGEKEIPQREQRCIESWKKFFPGYELILWNEDNFDISQCDFTKQAYEQRAYAFVSDYVRAKVLYEYGGIYMDTDVEVIGEFPHIEAENGFMGFERRKFLGTAIVGSVPGNDIIKEWLQYYEKNDFLQKNGDINNIANVFLLTDIMKKRGLQIGGEKQYVAGYEIFNREVFYPKKISETEIRTTDETKAIHWFSCSWLTDREKKRGNNIIWIKVARPVLQGMRNIGVKIIGKEKIKKLEIKLRNKLR